MIRHLLFLILILAVLCSINPVFAIDHNRIYEIVSELRGLAKKGSEIHAEYNLNNTADVRKCVAANGHLRKKAMALVEETKTIDDFFYKGRLSQAAYAAFSCVYCGGNGQSCPEVEPLLLETENLLKDDGFKFPKK